MMLNHERRVHGHPLRGPGEAVRRGRLDVVVGRRNASLFQGREPERQQQMAAHVLAVREPARAALHVLDLPVYVFGVSVGALGHVRVDHDGLYLLDAGGGLGDLLDAAVLCLAGPVTERLGRLALAREVGASPDVEGLHPGRVARVHHPSQLGLLALGWLSRVPSRASQVDGSLASHSGLQSRGVGFLPASWGEGRYPAADVHRGRGRAGAVAPFLVRIVCSASQF